MGNNVRYDGGNRNNNYCHQVLSEIFEYTIICPEKESGMSTPRPTIRLENNNEQIIAIEPKSLTDHTDAIKNIAKSRQREIENLSGYILTKNSPSCGLFRVKVYNNQGHIVHKEGRGIFSSEIKNNYPLLPMEEAERLNDDGLRENFLLRVIAYHQWKKYVLPNLSKHLLIDFYSQYKLVMLSHSPQHYKKIGAILSNLKSDEIELAAQRFIELFMQGLDKPATRKNHANTLMHIQGYFKRAFHTDDKQELAKLILAYKNGEVPLIAPITLLQHHLTKHPDPYLLKQKYINPYPKNLGLRNNI